MTVFIILFFQCSLLWNVIQLSDVIVVTSLVFGGVA